MAPRIAAAVPSSLQRSGIRKMLEKAWALQAQGRTVISLCVGEPDFPTPPHIVSAAQRALSEGQTRYIASSGLPTLRAAVAEQYAARASHRTHGVQNVLVSHGSMFAFSAAFMALLEPGDEVLIPDPGFPNYAQVAQLLHATARTYPLCARDGWLPDPVDIACRITPRTKLIVLCTPGNPTGAVCSLPLLQSLADVSRAHGVHLLSDEIYDRLVFDGSAAAPSILQTDHDPELTLAASGVACVAPEA
jgi:aspartate aminotransferase